MRSKHQTRQILALAFLGTVVNGFQFQESLAQSPCAAAFNPTSWKISTKVETERLNLEIATLEAADALLEIFNNPRGMSQEVTRFEPISREALGQLLEESKSDWSKRTSTENPSPLIFLMKSKASGEIIGLIEFFNVRRETKFAMIGYALDPQYWGKGYGTEATQSFVRFGFEELGLRTIDALVAAENTASVRVLEKVGFQEIRSIGSNNGLDPEFRHFRLKPKGFIRRILDWFSQ